MRSHAQPLPCLVLIRSARRFVRREPLLRWLSCALLWSCSTLSRASDPPTPAATSKPAAAVEAPSSAPAASDCGLPAALVARGWPRQLVPARARIEEELEAKTVSLAVLPDTQYYAACRSPHLRQQSEWISSQAERRNIAAVLLLGDLTDHNTPAEWDFFRSALEPVTSSLPTFLATGNHDHGDNGSANRRGTRLGEYFPAAPPPTAQVLSATLDPGDLENAYYRVKLPRVTLGVLVLEWSPRPRAVKWANAVLAEHASDRVIFVTHAYLYHDSTRYDWAARGAAQEWSPNAYGTAKVSDAKDPAAEGAYDGERLWRELVSRHAGIFLTLSGHVLGDGTGLARSTGDSRNVVHQVLVNYQMLDEGGLGYLRLVELLPSGRQLRMKTYSPSLRLWATAPDQQFELPIVPPLWE